MAQTLAEHAVKRQVVMGCHQTVPAPVFWRAPSPAHRDHAQINLAPRCRCRWRCHGRHTAPSTTKWSAFGSISALHTRRTNNKMVLVLDPLGRAPDDVPLPFRRGCRLLVAIVFNAIPDRDARASWRGAYRRARSPSASRGPPRSASSWGYRPAYRTICRSAPRRSPAPRTGRGRQQRPSGFGFNHMRFVHHHQQALVAHPFGQSTFHGDRYAVLPSDASRRHPRDAALARQRLHPFHHATRAQAPRSSPDPLSTPYRPTTATPRPCGPRPGPSATPSGRSCRSPSARPGRSDFRRRLARGFRERLSAAPSARSPGRPAPAGSAPALAGTDLPGGEQPWRHVLRNSALAFGFCHATAVRFSVLAARSPIGGSRRA